METLRNPTKTKARKDHRCDFCSYTIRKGEIYMKSTHIHDDIYDWKTHKSCSDLSYDLNMYDECYEGVTQEDFMEYVHDKHYKLLTNSLSDLEEEKYSDLINQAGHANFYYKLRYVIRTMNKDNKPA